MLCKAKSPSIEGNLQMISSALGGAEGTARLLLMPFALQDRGDPFENKNRYSDRPATLSNASCITLRPTIL